MEIKATYHQNKTMVIKKKLEPQFSISISTDKTQDLHLKNKLPSDILVVFTRKK